jgi:hypothetical protein
MCSLGLVQTEASEGVIASGHLCGSASHRGAILDVVLITPESGFARLVNRQTIDRQRLEEIVNKF